MYSNGWNAVSSCTVLAAGQICHVSYYGHVSAVGEGCLLCCDAIESAGHAPGQEQTACPF